MNGEYKLRVRPSVWLDAEGLRPAALLDERLTDYTFARVEEDGVRIKVDSDAQLQLIYGHTHTPMRVRVDVAAGATVHLHEVLLPWEGRHTRSVYTTLNLAAHAHLTLSSFYASADMQGQTPAEEEPTLLITREISVGREARLDLFNGFLGASARSQSAITLEGEGAEAQTRLISFGSGSDSQQHEVTTRHHAAHTYSEVLNHGVAMDEAVCRFMTLGAIQKGCSGSRAYHKSRVMALSDRVRAEVDPVLVIDEYDVKAAHAGSVGRVPEQTLYYLQSRGLTRTQAYRLVTTGFLLPILDGFGDADERAELEGLIENRVNRHVGL